MSILENVPDNWITAEIGSINCYKSMGINPSENPDEIFELYSVPSFPTGKPELLKGSEIGSTKQCVEPGDVLLCKINPRINRVWKVAPKGLYRQIASSEWIVIRQKLIDTDFLRYLFSELSFRDLLCSDVAGVGGSLTRAQPARVSKYEILVASLEEQKEIATRLDKLLAQVGSIKLRLDKIEEIIKRFRQSVLEVACRGMLTNDWRNAKNAPAWKTVLLKEIAEIKGGITKDIKKQKNSDIDIPYLRVANVQRGYIDLTEVKTIKIPKEKLNEFLLEKGDILLNEGGDIDKLGRGWIWEGQIEPCSYQNHVFRARLFNKENEPKYISWFANTIGFNFFLSSGKQTTGIASINKTMISNLEIQLPSPSEQKEIVKRIEELFFFISIIVQRVQAAKVRIDHLSQSILIKAFSGELTAEWREQHPELISGENSAVALLERIKEEKNSVKNSVRPLKSAKNVKIALKRK